MVHWRFKQLASIATAPTVRDVIIVSGFWRSGTTWLQQQVSTAMQARTIFEPLSPACGHEWAQISADNRMANQHTYMPLCVRDLTNADRAVLAKSVKGIGDHGYTYFLSNNISDCVAKNAVVKFTRIGFLLPELHQLFAFPVLHIRRHPGAVYASFKNTDWEWSFEDVRLVENYPAEAAHTKRPDLVSLLNEFDTNSAVRFATLWGASEREARKALLTKHVQLIEYTDLVDKRVHIPEILNKFNIEAQSQSYQDQVSPVTTPDRQELSAAQRKNDWKDRLEASEVADIVETLKIVFPEALEIYEMG